MFASELEYILGTKWRQVDNGGGIGPDSLYEATMKDSKSQWFQ